jgi:uncharacterized protein (DUF362 family)/Pyruvate/2-oxoacid:ferredoxin oxidoreductase delta subunit
MEASHSRAPAVVSLVALPDYAPERVSDALRELLEPLGGMAGFVRADESVLLKPNFLFSRTPEQAVCTHPEIIRGVAAEASRVGGGRVVVTDSPGVGTARRVARRQGLGDDEPFVLRDADDGYEPERPEARFRHLKLSRRIVETRCVINLAKVKTHGQMVMTGAVKNMFGAVVGFDKAQWHYRIGRNEHEFARLLIDVYETTAPILSIVDGVVAMEGNGPGSGRPRRMGILAASTDAHALDLVLAHLWGLSAQQVFTLALAREMGLVGEFESIRVHGPRLESLRPSPPWRMARPAGIDNLSRIGPLQPLVERVLSLTPRVSKLRCTGCGQCRRACAAEAMDLVPGGSASGLIARVDKKKCISCFCCQEVCPEGAIDVRAGAVARLLGLDRR